MVVGSAVMVVAVLVGTLAVAAVVTVGRAFRRGGRGRHGVGVAAGVGVGAGVAVGTGVGVGSGTDAVRRSTPDGTTGVSGAKPDGLDEPPPPLQDASSAAAATATDTLKTELRMISLRGRGY